MKSQEKVIKITGSITVDELAKALGLSVTTLIGTLFKEGIVATINQRLDFDTATLIIDELGIEGVRLERRDTTTRISNAKHELSEKAVERPPVVAVMGHVDHGKTTLLDNLLKKKTVESEAGGITQHISAYQLEHDGKLITFLDTPGHEAFAAIRQHGAMLTDIVVIVVAADDGVKPQTVEAINFAKNANAKVIVAINKIDREGADIPRTMADLAEHGLTPEEWGGDVTMVPISAKRGDNLDKLVELILLTAEMEELKADIEVPSEGLVIESHMETGKGSVVNLLVTEGELKSGEFIVAGSSWGKVRTMLDFRGKPKGKARPSTPVTVTGFKTLPQFGERFIEAKDEKSARKMALLNANESMNAEASSNVTSGDLLRMMTAADTAKVFNVVIKGDVLGSVTSVVDSLKMIDTGGEVILNIVATGVGDVTENDVYMATGEKTVVYGFNVGIPVNIAKMATREGVEVKCFRVIYELLDDAKGRMEEMMDPEVIEEVVGEMELQGVFRVEKTRLIAGGKMRSGRVAAGDLVRISEKSGSVGVSSTEIGEIESVQIEKNAVEKLAEGEIGGLAVKTEKKADVKVGDKIEFFRREIRKKKL